MPAFLIKHNENNEELFQGNGIIMGSSINLIFTNNLIAGVHNETLKLTSVFRASLVVT